MFFGLFNKKETCEVCHKPQKNVVRRKVQLPIGPTALSQKKMCDGCYDLVNKMLEINGN